jgi:hypothetical protein
MCGGKRDIVERKLMERFSDIKPYSPKLSSIIERFKDGTFGVGNLAFALYSNGRNPRGESTNNPYGLLFYDEETLFSIGYYRRKYDKNNDDGYVFFVAPRGRDATKKVADISHQVLSDSEIPCKGVYLRFLTLDQYIELLNYGFLPAKENPWHADSPEEDETLTNSLLRIDSILTDEGAVKTLEYGGKDTRRKSRMTHKRFENFLRRNELKYSLQKYMPQCSDIAQHVVEAHFNILGKNGSLIGSTIEDYLNLVDPKLIELESVRAYLGFLREVPVSYFVGEKVSDSRFALYTSFTLRSPELVMSCISSENEEANKGFSAMSIFSYIELLKRLRNEGITEVLFGGSEHRDLNRIKRQLGCRNVPSYWAVKTKEPVSAFAV